MRKLLNCMAGLLCILLSPALLPAQNKTITGRVTDAKIAPLAGVSITVAKTNSGAVTDADGKFNLSAPENARIVISLTGFKSQTIKLESTQTEIQVKMEEDFARLDEVVLTGLVTTVK